MWSLRFPPTGLVTTALTASMESAYRDLIPLCFSLAFHLFLPHKITLQPCMFVRGDAFKHGVRFCIKKNSLLRAKISVKFDCIWGIGSSLECCKNVPCAGRHFSWIRLPIEQFLELCITLCMPPCAQVCHYFHNTKPKLCFALKLP